MIPFLKLIAPALFPSWRFFDVIAPSPRIEYTLLKNPHTTPEHWQEFRPRPTHLSFLQMLRRMVWNARWNESLFMTSCAERIASNPADHAIQEITQRMKIDLARDIPKDLSHFQFRLVFLYPDGATLKRHVIYQSPISKTDEI